ncbi:hypothetical protein FRB94_006266 [Tulasnella sp. JGI-2019a]|nr:hypothetical protein FRB93_006688 [Tulasnella sp. JGI-2019a]KAG8999281.1 hypothetical protein FRB94_006266 [Tulasnella sp. JGI-2019a]
MASQELRRSAGTHIQGAAQISLDLLQSLSNLIPVPYVTIIVATVSQLIQIAQTVQNNVKGVDVLIERLKAITLVILTSLKGKKLQDVPKDLEQSIAKFKTDLLAIEKTVSRVKKRTDTSGLSIIKAFLRYGDNAGLIAECTSRLAWAIQYFEVESRIQGSIRIAQMANEVHEVHKNVKNIKQGVDMILENLDIIPRLPMPSAAIPPKPALFYGRDTEVEDIAHCIVTTRPSRFGITGAGGIGKTSLASAILEHTDIIQYFESRIHWARCDEASSVPLLIEIIAKAFRLDQSSKDRLQDIKSFLQSNTQPRLLVLDDFETPWDIEGRQSDITDVLCVLAAFSHLAILVTMRGTLPGVGRVRWSRPELPPLAVLPSKASRELYVDIDPKAASDEALETLLSELDHMPLAVTLMAKIGSEGETPTQLLKTWRLRGTEIIHEEGGDRRTSVNLSIQLSLQSHLMRNNPDALRLLSVLAMLPGGIRNDIIEDVVPDIEYPTKARSVLLRTSLVYSRAGTNSFHVLSPIRSYITQHHPPTPELWRGLRDFCWIYIAMHSAPPANYDAFGLEEVNLEAVLSYALQHDPTEDIVEISLYFTLYQHATNSRSGPHLALIAVEAAERVGNASQVAFCLERLGAIYIDRGQFKEAQTSLGDAHARFVELGDGWYAAECVRQLGVIARVTGRYDEARDAFEKARHEYSMLEDANRLAFCLLQLGVVAFMEGRYNDARSAYEESRVKYVSIGGLIMDCLAGLGDVARMEGRYQDSRDLYNLARAEAVENENQYQGAWNLFRLAVTDVMDEQYESARKELPEAQEVFTLHRDSNGAAECLKWLGNIDRGEGRFEEARRNLEVAHQEFVQLGQSPDIAECLQGLGYTEAVEGQYKEGRQHLEEAIGIFRRLGIPKGVADCLTSLGELSMKEGHIVEAQSSLEEARASYQTMGVGDWWQSRCVTLLADLSSPSD